MEGAGALEKLRLDFAGVWPLRGAMPETDDDMCHEIVRRLFCLITIADEDAAALAIKGQAKRLALDNASLSADRLKTLDERIDILSAAITELIQSVGKDDATT